jgi:FlaA1/EpsC-like NDP-sugar epimerase
MVNGYAVRLGRCVALQRITGPLLGLPRPSKRLIVLAVDASLCALAVWFAFYLRLGAWISLGGRPTIAVAISVGLALPTFAVAGLYGTAFRHLGADTVRRAATACAIYGLGYAVVVSAYAFSNVPRTVGLIQPVLLFLGVVASRWVASVLLTAPRIMRRSDYADRPRVLIYGAGSSGQQLAGALAGSREMKVVGYLDDDASLQGSSVRGIRVHRPADLQRHVERLGVTDVLLALPSVPRRRRNEILALLRGAPVGVRTLPGLLDLAHGRVQAGDLRDLTIEDLLSRDPVEPDHRSVRSRIEGKVILVTGAGGSIGSELCRQIVALDSAQLLLVEANEYALYAIHRQLEEHDGVEVVPLLGSVTDTARMEEILTAWRPGMIFHAAAYKHVPLVEHNPLEGLRNNVLGTWVMAELAIKHRVDDFVLVSTDKAVRPTNVMGATKRLAELTLQGLSSSQAATRLSMVRFGNVLGSSGSVVPLFREQIRTGGPITITHREITRYFMTIPEAAQLVVQASAMAKGGEVFVLDMGEPVRIHDLARNLIELSGLMVRDKEHPDGDIEIVTVGLRPGEKLYEELLIGNDPMATTHPRIMMATEHHLSWEVLRPKLERMERLIMDNNVPGSRSLLCELVPEYAPTSEIVDWVHLARATQFRAAS